MKYKCGLLRSLCPLFQLWETKRLVLDLVVSHVLELWQGLHGPQFCLSVDQSAYHYCFTKVAHLKCLTLNILLGTCLHCYELIQTLILLKYSGNSCTYKSTENSFFTSGFYGHKLIKPRWKKSCICETLNLLTCADSSTNAKMQKYKYIYKDLKKK